MLKNPRQLFLLDGIGTLVSAFLLGVVMVKFQRYFGMPTRTLYFLAALPCLFGIFDFVCYFSQVKNWRMYLKVIAIFNIIYCIISVVEMYLKQAVLTPLGFSYFTVEIIIVFALAIYELKVANNVSTVPLS